MTPEMKAQANLCHVDDCLRKAKYFEVLTELLFCPDHWKEHERGEDYE